MNRGGGTDGLKRALSCAECLSEQEDRSSEVDPLPVLIGAMIAPRLGLYDRSFRRCSLTGRLSALGPNPCKVDDGRSSINPNPVSARATPGSRSGRA
eukprot:scaffold1104_cov299-Prasinococcus_capsulatus_cf.AAC.17